MSTVLTADTFAGIQNIIFEPFGNQIKVTVIGTNTNQCSMTTEAKVAACMIKNLKDLNAEDKVIYSPGFSMAHVAYLQSLDPDLANTQTKTDEMFRQLLAPSSPDTESAPSQSATSSWIDTAEKIAVCALAAIAASALTFGTIYLSIGVIYAAYIIVATNPIATLSVVGAISAFVGTVCFFSGLDKF